ncbi:MAG: hypothetical protein IJU76_08730 [Desulfovibrionaceae bacterium]|nr:hypothetical protein [Desulfovibrionaceae bacterium]
MLKGLGVIIVLGLIIYAMWKRWGKAGLVSVAKFYVALLIFFILASEGHGILAICIVLASLAYKNWDRLKALAKESPEERSEERCGVSGETSLQKRQDDRERKLEEELANMLRQYDRLEAWESERSEPSAYLCDESDSRGRKASLIVRERARERLNIATDCNPSTPLEDIISALDMSLHYEMQDLRELYPEGLSESTVMKFRQRFSDVVELPFMLHSRKKEDELRGRLNARTLAASA